MSIPPADYPVEYDPLLLERQRRRYASRAITYLVLLNGIAALIILASLIHAVGEVPRPGKLSDAMLIFGAGTAIGLGSTFFAYLRRTVRLQAPERIPLRVSLWWLSVIAAIAAAACFVFGLHEAGRATVGGGPGIAKSKDHRGHKEQSRAERENRKEGKHKREKEQAKEDDDEQTTRTTAPEAAETPAQPQSLTRTECEQAGRMWNESTNTCS